MQQTLSEAACRIAGAYFAKKRRAGRCAILLAIVCFALGTELMFLLGPYLGMELAACCGTLLCGALLFGIVLFRKKRQNPGEGYLDTVRPMLARELYPDCSFTLLGTQQQMQRRLQEASIWVISGELEEYGGSICLATPSGTVYAHDFTEDCRPGDSDSCATQDWVVYELALPPGSPWKDIGLARIRRGRAEQSRMAGALQNALHRLPHRKADGLQEERVEGTPLVLYSTDLAHARAVLRQTGGSALQAFFRACGGGSTVCYCSGTLYVFAQGRRLDQRWSGGSRFEEDVIARNAEAVSRTIHAVAALV